MATVLTRHRAPRFDIETRPAPKPIEFVNAWRWTTTPSGGWKGVQIGHTVTISRSHAPAGGWVLQVDGFTLPDHDWPTAEAARAAVERCDLYQLGRAQSQIAAAFGIR